MARLRINSTTVRGWALEHLHDPDGVAYNRYTRIASRLDYLESELAKVLSENDRLHLALSGEQPIIFAHRVPNERAIAH